MNYSIANINGLNVFFRESGDKSKPTFLLLHGFPSSSHMFRNLMPLLEERFHVIAPDYIGFGQSDAPAASIFEYTFEHLTDYVQALLKFLGIEKYYMYVFDYGAPIGFRLALRNPDAVLGIVSQNGNIYEKALGEKWSVRKVYWDGPTAELRLFLQGAYAASNIIRDYLTGEPLGAVSPDGYSLDIFYTYREGFSDRQDALILDYRTNVALYPEFQRYVKERQPKLLAIWGKNGESFLPIGAEAFAEDDPNAEVILLEAGHYALETQCKRIADEILARF